jgi:heme exporter protein A
VLLSQTVARPAKLWILDEPFTALDVKAVDFLSHLIADHVKAGGIAVVTSHQAIPLPPGQVVDL